MRKIFILLFILCNIKSFSQNRKEQIEILNGNLDSLKIILDLERNSNLKNIKLKSDSINELSFNLDSLRVLFENERNINLKKTQDFNLKVASLNSQIATLDSSERILMDSLNRAQIEIKKLYQSLNLNLIEIANLKQCLNNKNDSLIIIKNELKNNESLNQKFPENAPENNFDQLSLKFKNKEKDIAEYKKWINTIVAKEFDGDTTYFTINCLEYINDIILLTEGLDESIDEKIVNKKWGTQFDLKYSKFGHIFESGNGGWATKKLTKVDYLGELNNGDWFKLTIKGGPYANDLSNTLVRVIKIIKKGNGFYIDNFISLSKE